MCVKLTEKYKTLRNKFNKNQSFSAVSGALEEDNGTNRPRQFPRVDSIFVAFIVSQGKKFYQLV